MALQGITLEGAARVFGVHPRTILRAISKEHNTYWYEDSNEDMLSVADIAEAYGVREIALNAVFEGRDSLLRADEAAKILGMAARTFRKHLHNDDGTNWGRVASGGITRYLRSRIMDIKISITE